MKRTRQASEPGTTRAVRAIAADDLAKARGGATAIEYGLALLAPPPTK